MADLSNEKSRLIPYKYYWLAFLLMVILADVLFFDRGNGVAGSLPLLTYYLALLLFFWPKSYFSRPKWFGRVFLAVIALSAAGMLLGPCFLSVLLCIFSVGVISMVYQMPWSESFSVWFFRCFVWCLAGVFNLPWTPVFIHRLSKEEKEQNLQSEDKSSKVSGKGLFYQLKLWIFPILTGMVFLLLFSMANPMIEKVLSFNLDWLPEVPGARIIFWIFIAMLLGAFQGAVAVNIISNSLEHENSSNLSGGWLAGKSATVLRCLIVANLVFLWQNIYDIEYLWAKFDLPPGVTYAEYAHRGAYMLIVTAMLAGLLCAIFFSGRYSEKDWIWPGRMVYIWILQNVFLVFSAFFRLVKYVDVYGLTRLRVAAACWMLLVAVGLVLVGFFVIKRRSIRFLLWSNTGSVLALLLIVNLLDINGFIADYNVRHGTMVIRGESVNPRSANLDSVYLDTLGYEAVPAILEAQENGLLDKMKEDERKAMLNKVKDDISNMQRENKHIYSWTLRNYFTLKEIERRFPGYIK